MTLDTIPSGSGTIPDCIALLPFHCVSFATLSHLSQLLTPHVGFILGLAIILAVKYARSPRRKVPPGPKGLPILGNALQLKDKRWMFEKDCKQKFRTPNSIVVDSAPQIYQIGSSKYHVLECPWPAHYRF
jgi:hypothetical protein